MELHKLLIVEFLPFVHEVSSLTYCQEGHLGILGYLQGKCCVFFVTTLNEAELCFREVNSIKFA